MVSRKKNTSQKVSLKRKHEPSLPKRDTKNKTKLSVFNRLKLRFAKDKAFIITMLFKNGTSKTFVLTSKKPTFKYKGNLYYIDYEESWFDITQHQFHLYYHESYAVPINRELTRDGDENYFTVTPENLKPLIKMEYVKTLAQSQELSRYLKITMVLSGFTFFAMMVLSVLIYQLSKGLGVKLF